MLCQLKIDGAPFEFDLQGDFFWGQDEVLFREGNNAIAKNNQDHGADEFRQKRGHSIGLG